MRLLVIRNSAMGDVALTSPVLTAMRKKYPDTEIVLLTRQPFKYFFSSIDGLKFFFPDLKKRHTGFLGLIRLFKDIRGEAEINYIIDLHDVLRSKVLRFFFRLSGIPGAVIDKGRSEKSLLISGKKKFSLKHSVDRYCDVFAKAGFPLTLTKGETIVPSSEAMQIADSMISNHNQLNIGIAPYAKHKLKMWPEGNMIHLIELLYSKHKARFWLFGGNDESERLVLFQKKIPDSFNTAGKLNLGEELALMSKLDLMIVMDSSNMHMAALMGIKVVSIWGGTDPMGGFGAWMQPEKYSISIPVTELTCRPCTIYGKGECRRGDLACMNWLTPEKVFEKIENLDLINK